MVYNTIKSQKSQEKTIFKNIYNMKSNIVTKKRIYTYAL